MFKNMEKWVNPTISIEPFLALSFLSNPLSSDGFQLTLFESFVEPVSHVD